ncbi:MAG: threonine synthase [Candidatus Lokiarchaeia archaeon]
MSFAETLRCLECGKEHPFDEIIYNCGDCGGKGLFHGTVDVIYDLEEAKEKIDRSLLEFRHPSVWKYFELLPILDKSNIVSLGEGGTPLVKCDRYALETKSDNLYMKNEFVNPTLSFKDRVFTVNISKAVEYGVDTIVMASSGNAATAASAYCAKAGLKCYIFIPGEASLAKIANIIMNGAKTIKIKGTVINAAVLAVEASWKWGWYQLTTAKSLSPYQGEGSKTIAYEICEQLGWKAPDWVFVPVGGGDNIGGVWKGFKEFHELGLIKTLPHMVGVQAEGAATIVNTFNQGKDYTEAPMEDAETIAEGIRTGICPGPWPLMALRESKGVGVAVSDEEILEAEKILAKTEGIFCEPSSAAAAAGFKKFREQGKIDRSDIVVCVLTGAGLKDIDAALKLIEEPPLIEPKMVELEKLVT